MSRNFAKIGSIVFLFLALLLLADLMKPIRTTTVALDQEVVLAHRFSLRQGIQALFLALILHPNFSRFGLFFNPFIAKELTPNSSTSAHKKAVATDESVAAALLFKPAV